MWATQKIFATGEKKKNSSNPPREKASSVLTMKCVLTFVKLMGGITDTVCLTQKWRVRRG